MPAHRSRRPLARHAGASLAGMLALAACTGEPAVAPTSPPVQPSASPAPTSPSSPRASQPRNDTPHPVSLPALMETDFDGRAFRVRRELGRTDAYISYAVTYRGGGLRLSGLMNVPVGDGPFPVLVLAHGYIDPAVYRTGRGFERSQAYLASRGFVVMHVDYRNHASSDDDPDNDLHLRLGYTEDVINAVLAIRRAGLPYVDRARIGLLGRSMGGGIAFNVGVVAPHLVDAIATFAPVSSDAVDNFNRWIRRPDRRALADRIIDAFGSPERNPAFWADLSARNFFGRIRVPVQIHHGTDDESVPIAWSRRTAAAMERENRNVRLFVYPGEGHSFGPAYARAMERTVRFFRANLR